MDELQRLRELAEDVPDPDPRRKALARSELLQLAEAEQGAADEGEEPRPTHLEALLATLRRSLLRPAPAAGFAALVLAAAGTVVLLTGQETDPSAELADQDPPPEVSVDPDADPGDGTDPGNGTDPGDGTDAGIELAASCTDPEGQVTVAYPEDWHTPESGEPGACRFFGQEDFEVDAAVGGAPLAELEVAVEPTPFEEVATAGVSFDELEREELDIADRRALRQRLEVTGEATLPEGVLVERVLVDLDGATLMLTVQDEDAGYLDERRPLLEQMAHDLELHDDR